MKQPKSNVQLSASKLFCLQLFSIRFLLVLIYFLSPFNCFGQQQKIGSLFSVLKTSTEDTNKINLLNSLCWELKNSSPDTAMYLCNEALLISEKQNWEKGIAVSQQKDIVEESRRRFWIVFIMPEEFKEVGCLPKNLLQNI